MGRTSRALCVWAAGAAALLAGGESLRAAAGGKAPTTVPARADAKLATDTLPPTLEVDAILQAKSDTPRKGKLIVYREALGVYEYEVLRTLRGQAPPKRILVTHWVVKQNFEQPVAGMRIGQKLRLRLRPFDDLKGLHEVYRSHTIANLDSPMFHDVGQRLVLPEAPEQRWRYNVEVGEKLRTLHRLRDQVRLVVLGDCAAAVAQRAELYMPEANRATPVAYNLCQERAGLLMQKALVETYVVRLPRLEWVMFSWDTRLANGSWPTHGLKYGRFIKSPGYAFDLRHGDDWRPDPDVAPVTVADIEADAGIGPRWKREPWGWHRTHRLHGWWTNPFGQMAAAARQEGVYRFSEERWKLYTDLVKMLMDRKVKMLAFIPPYHPKTAELAVKDKDGTCAADYQAQVKLHEALEKQYPGQYFFYDLNRMGRHGVLDADDFGDIDHTNDTGAMKLTTHLEEWRRKLEQKLAAGGAANR